MTIPIKINSVDFCSGLVESIYSLVMELYCFTGLEAENEYTELYSQPKKGFT